MKEANGERFWSKEEVRRAERRLSGLAGFVRSVLGTVDQPAVGDWTESPVGYDPVEPPAGYKIPECPRPTAGSDNGDIASIFDLVETVSRLPKRGPQGVASHDS
jgi:hypothetical protein